MGLETHGVRVGGSKNDTIQSIDPNNQDKLYGGSMSTAT